MATHSQRPLRVESLYAALWVHADRTASGLTTLDVAVFPGQLVEDLDLGVAEGIERTAAKSTDELSAPVHITWCELNDGDPVILDDPKFQVFWSNSTLFEQLSPTCRSEIEAQTSLRSQDQLCGL